jgi:hypothetical protein
VAEPVARPSVIEIAPNTAHVLGFIRKFILFSDFNQVYALIFLRLSLNVKTYFAACSPCFAFLGPKSVVLVGTAPPGRGRRWSPLNRLYFQSEKNA